MSVPIKGLIFDKDGCLFDFNATWAAWARHVIKEEAGGDTDQLAALAQALGYDFENGRFEPDSIVIAAPARDIALAALPHTRETSVDALLVRWNAAAMRVPQVEVTPLVALFDQLRGADLRLGLATNDAEAPARAHLDAAKIAFHFDFIAGYDSGFGGKPAPGQLLAFCKATGLTPETCVMIGDSTHDLHAGRAAGMRTIGVLTGIATRGDLAPHADVVLNSIADLPDWLGLTG